jgi:signal transduction histidine kinase
VRFAIRLAWLAVLVALVGDQLARRDTGGRIGGAVALAVASIGWIGWSRIREARRPLLTAAALVALGAGGAVLAPWAGLGLVFLAVAGIASAESFDLPQALALTACGPVLLVVIVFTEGHSRAIALGGVAAALAGIVGGVGRRQAREQHARTTQLAVAREVHDVLAHTLSAVAVQLEAADAVLENGGDPAKLRSIVQRSRSLVGDGIAETRDAVRALRDEPVELAGRLRDLAARDAVVLHVTGEPRPLPPKAGLALYRAAQEALTNARKHAPGAPLTMTLEFRPDDVVLRVDNAAATAEPTAVQSGFGLQGMRERLELAGGALDVGETPSGWRVEARIRA